MSDDLIINLLILVFLLCVWLSKGLIIKTKSSILCSCLIVMNHWCLTGAVDKKDISWSSLQCVCSLSSTIASETFLASWPHKSQTFLSHDPLPHHSPRSDNRKTTGTCKHDRGVVRMRSPSWSESVRERSVHVKGRVSKAIIHHRIVQDQGPRR